GRAARQARSQLTGAAAMRRVHRSGVNSMLRWMGIAIIAVGVLVFGLFPVLAWVLTRSPEAALMLRGLPVEVAAGTGRRVVGRRAGPGAHRALRAGAPGRGAHCAQRPGHRGAASARWPAGAAQRGADVAERRQQPCRCGIPGDGTGTPAGPCLLVVAGRSLAQNGLMSESQSLPLSTRSEPSEIMSSVL